MGYNVVHYFTGGDSSHNQTDFNAVVDAAGTVLWEEDYQRAKAQRERNKT